MATLAVTIDNNGNLLSCLAEVFITLPMGVVFEENVLVREFIAHPLCNTVTMCTYIST